MRQGLFILLAILVIGIVAVFAMQSGNFLLSPSPSPAPMPTSLSNTPGLYGIIVVLANGLNGLSSQAPGRVSPSTADTTDCPSSPPSSTCQTFKTNSYKVTDPFNMPIKSIWGPDWNDYLNNNPGISSEISKIFADSAKWAGGYCTKCFPNSINSVTFSLYVQPADNLGGSCASAGKTFKGSTISVSDSNTLPGIMCEVAALGAASKFREAIRNFLIGACGDGCGTDVTFDDVKPNIIEDKVNSRCTATISATPTVTCTDKPKDNGYVMWGELNVCVSCLGRAYSDSVASQ